MFDLPEALASWRREMQVHGLRSPAVLDELEAHLLDEMDRRLASGLAAEAAFYEAAATLGDPAAMREEFRKLRGDRFGRLALIGGAMFDLDDNPARRHAFVCALRTLFGLALLTALPGLYFVWQSMTIQGERPYPSQLGFPWHTILGLVSLVLVLLGAALHLKAKIPARLPAWLRVTPFMLLVPYYLLVALALLLFTPPFLQRLFLPEKVFLSAISPDSRTEAYVIARPTLDESDHHLYLRRVGEKRGHEVGHLGFEKITHIDWSPDGQVAVFRSHLLLIAARARDFKSRTVSLGALEAWKHGTFAMNCRDLKTVTSLEFPRPGVVTWHYTLHGQPGSETLDLNLLFSAAPSVAP